MTDGTVLNPNRVIYEMFICSFHSGVLRRPLRRILITDSDGIGIRA